MANWWPVLKDNYITEENKKNPFVTLCILHFVHNASDAVVEPDVHLMLLWNQMYKQLLISATALVQAGVAAEWLAPSWLSMAQVVTKPLYTEVSNLGLKKGKTWTPKTAVLESLFMPILFLQIFESGKFQAPLRKERRRRRKEEDSSIQMSCRHTFNSSKVRGSCPVVLCAAHHQTCNAPCS